LVFQSRKFLDEVVLGLEFLLCADNSITNVPRHMSDDDSDVLLRELRFARYGILAFIDRGRECVMDLEHYQDNHGQESEEYGPGGEDGLKAGEARMGLFCGAKRILTGGAGGFAVVVACACMI
jgi:hypothetical protein